MRNLVAVRSPGGAATTPDSFSATTLYQSAVGQAPGTTTFSVVAAVRNNGPSSDLLPIFGNSTNPTTNGWSIIQNTDGAGPPTTRGVLGWSIVNSSGPAIQVAGYNYPSGLTLDTKTQVFVGTFVAGTGIYAYNNGILVAQDVAVGTGFTAGAGRLELGFQSWGVAVPQVNDIILAAYLPGTQLTQAQIDEITQAVLEEGTLDRVDPGFTHWYEARDLVASYNTGSVNSLPSSWANKGSVGATGDLTLSAATYGTLQVRPAIGF